MQKYNYNTKIVCATSRASSPSSDFVLLSWQIKMAELVTHDLELQNESVGKVVLVIFEPNHLEYNTQKIMVKSMEPKL